jgi:hypothetical protein
LLWPVYIERIQLRQGILFSSFYSRLIIYSGLTTTLHDREHREQDSVDVTNAVILLSSCSLGVLDKIKFLRKYIGKIFWPSPAAATAATSQRRASDISDGSNIAFDALGTLLLLQFFFYINSILIIIKKKKFFIFFFI